VDTLITSMKEAADLVRDGDQSAHAGITLDEVQERTGFPLHARAPMPVTPPPTARELDLLRTTVHERLSSIYPEFVRAEGRSD
jgi:hypothetical protein